MNDFLTALWALLTGLTWAWEFLAILVVACLAIAGGLTVLDLVDRWYDRRQRRKDRVRVLDLRTGREQWVPVAQATRDAMDRTSAEIRNLPEVRRG